MQIVIVPASIEITNNKRATAVIFAQQDDVTFPELHWNDFADVLLVEWSRRMRDVILNDSKEAILHFMEGPFSIRLHRDCQGWLVSFRRKKQFILPPSTVVFTDVCKSIVVAGEELLCDDRFLTRMPEQAANLRVALDGLRSVCGNGTFDGSEHA